MPDWSFACKYQTRDKVTESDKLAYYVAESIPTIKSYIKCRPERQWCRKKAYNFCRRPIFLNMDIVWFRNRLRNRPQAVGRLQNRFLLAVSRCLSIPVHLFNKCRLRLFRLILTSYRRRHTRISLSWQICLILNQSIQVSKADPTQVTIFNRLATLLVRHRCLEILDIRSLVEWPGTL